MHATKDLPLAAILHPVAYTLVFFALIDEEAEPHNEVRPMLATESYPVAVMFDPDAYSTTPSTSTIDCCEPKEPEAKPTPAKAWPPPK